MTCIHCLFRVPNRSPKLSQVKKQNTSPRHEAKKATAEDDEVDLSDSEYEEYSEYVTDSQVRFLPCSLCTMYVLTK